MYACDEGDDDDDEDDCSTGDDRNDGNTRKAKLVCPKKQTDTITLNVTNR